MVSMFQEYPSWFSPSPVEVSDPPTIGSKAPSTSKLPIPNKDGKPTVITFLRHCGCPFAEATFINLRETASKYPKINFIAISHSNKPSTDKWLEALSGPGTSAANPIQVIVDSDRSIYGAWGLGVSGWGHVLSPSVFSVLYKLGKEKNIWNRPTESGSRWQTGGNYGVDANGVVRWGGVSQRADEVPEFEEAIDAIEGGGKSAKL